MEHPSKSHMSILQSLLKERYYNSKKRWVEMKADVKKAYQEHITTMFWIRLGVRICLSLLYLVLAKCEHDMVAMVFSQIDQPCILYYEVNKPAQELLIFGCVPILPDFFLGIFGIFPLYRVYNDPFVISYNIIIATMGIIVGSNTKLLVNDCGEVAKTLAYASNIQIAIGLIHIVPVFGAFVMLRKEDYYLLISRIMRCFKSLPYEGFWWSLPKFEDFVNVHLEVTDDIEFVKKKKVAKK